MRTATLTIDQSALSANLAVIRSQVPPATGVLAMIKANAYGHGVANVLPSLMTADGFGVATFNEGQEVYQICQDLGQSKPIVLIEGVFNEDEWERACELGFGCLIHCREQADWALNHVPQADSPTRTIWLKYNTGMNRLGFGRDEILPIAKALHDKGYRLILTSHFACADDKAHPLNKQQITAFDSLLNELQSTLDPSIQGSLCNSAGIFNFPQVHHHWVRAGIALYGGSPVAKNTANALNLRPAMSLTAKVMAIHQLNAGETVGYGALWQAVQPSRIGIVSIGYGDGYPRVVKGAWVTLIQDKKTYQAPIIGRVAMDMLMIDLTALPCDVGAGADVVLWGASPTADEIAGCADTISYELFCRLTGRAMRLLV